MTYEQLNKYAIDLYYTLAKEQLSINGERQPCYVELSNQSLAELCTSIEVKAGVSTVEKLADGFFSCELLNGIKCVLRVVK